MGGVGELESECLADSDPGTESSTNLTLSINDSSERIIIQSTGNILIKAAMEEREKYQRIDKVGTFLYL